MSHQGEGVRANRRRKLALITARAGGYLLLGAIGLAACFALSRFLQDLFPIPAFLSCAVLTWGLLLLVGVIVEVLSLPVYPNAVSFEFPHISRLSGKQFKGTASIREEDGSFVIAGRALRKSGAWFQKAYSRSEPVVVGLIIVAGIATCIFSLIFNIADLREMPPLLAGSNRAQEKMYVFLSVMRVLVVFLAPLLHGAIVAMAAFFGLLFVRDRSFFRYVEVRIAKKEIVGLTAGYGGLTIRMKPPEEDFFVACKERDSLSSLLCLPIQERVTGTPAR
jgi:hypothetical protein